MKKYSLTDTLLLALIVAAQVAILNAATGGVLYSSIDWKGEIHEHVIVKRESEPMTRFPTPPTSVAPLPQTTSPVTFVVPTSSPETTTPTRITHDLFRTPTTVPASTLHISSSTSTTINDTNSPTTTPSPTTMSTVTTMPSLTLNVNSSTPRTTNHTNSPTTMPSPITSSPTPTTSSTTTTSKTTSSTTTTSKTTSSITNTASEVTPSTFPNGVNITDNHDYYKATYYTNNMEKFQQYWFELNEDNSVTSTLSDLHRKAQVVVLPWSFYFYGTLTNKTIVTTGGFISTGSIHSAITHSQYIAPLMADFNPTIDNTMSKIFYLFTDDEAIIQWNGVTINNHREAGPFTFQARIKKETGDIIFVYKTIPQPLSSIPSAGLHPVKAGLSDGFLFFSWSQNVNVFYKYHDLKLEQSRIGNNTVIVLKHSKLCNMMTTCDECLSSDLTDFNCEWCTSLGKCSSGMDRETIQWLNANCHQTDVTTCPVTQPPVKPDSSSQPAVAPNKAGEASQISYHADHSGVVAGVTIGVFLLVVLAATIVMIVYGYRNPHSSVGRFLIANRPSRLMQRWKDSRSTESSDRYRINLSELPEA